MRVLHFLGIGRLPKRPMLDATGGTERSALEVARLQRLRGHDVTIASMAEENWKGEWEGVKLRHVKPYAWPQQLTFGRVKGSHLALAALVQSGRFDLVHLHEYLNTRLFGGRPNVMHFHNSPQGDRDVAQFAQDAPEYWRRVGRSSAQIAVSEFVAGKLRLAHASAGADALPANIVKVPGGVHSNALSRGRRLEDRRRVRQALGLNDSDVLFLFSGAVRPEKGVDYLARAFAKLSDEYPGACLAIAGGSKLWVEPGWMQDGAPEDMEQQVRDILTPAIARNRAFMLGLVPPVEIDAFYAASDVFVLPSMAQEAFGLVLLEAFSAGLPVVAFQSGGIPELVEDGANGLVVPQGDEAALYQSMRALMLDPALRARLGAAGEGVPASMPWENTVNRLETVYQDVRGPMAAAGGTWSRVRKLGRRVARSYRARLRPLDLGYDPYDPASCEAEARALLDELSVGPALDPEEMCRRLLAIAEVSAPTEALAAAYFANLQTVLADKPRLETPGRVVIGLGPGRCGSTSLSTMLGTVANSCCTHETPPPIAWTPRSQQVEFHLRRFEMLAGHYSLVSDVSHWWLNCLEQVFDRFPEAKAIGLIRYPDDCARSFMPVQGGGRGSFNPWATPRNGIWKAGHWDATYPSYALPDYASREPDRAKLALITRYVTEYNAELEALASRAPGRIELVRTEELSHADVQAKIFQLAGALGQTSTWRLNAESTVADGLKNHIRV